MESGQSFDVLVRKGIDNKANDQMYHVRVFKKIMAIDELLEHPEIATLLNNKIVRVEKIDNFRFTIFLTKC